MEAGTERIAITGASGFLGRALCHVAVECGHHVTAVVRNRQSELPAQEMVIAGVLDEKALCTAFRGATAVVHAAGLAHVYGAAAQDEAAFQMVNVRGTEAVVEAAVAEGVPHLVLASSVSVYGGSGGSACDETAPVDPRTPYARSKWLAELRATERFESHGQLTILRFATIYGEGDRGNVARLIRNVRRGVFVWPGPGRNRKSLIYKDDAARACLAALRQPRAGIYNVSADPVSMREIVEAICLALPKPVPSARIPMWLVEASMATAGSLRGLHQLEQGLRKFLADDVYVADRFCETFGFAAETPLQEGLAREVRSL